MKKKPGRLDALESEIVRLAKLGATCPEIGVAIGETNVELIRKVLIRLNVKRQPIGAQKGKKNHAWRGGATIDKSGYVLVYCPDHPRANSCGYVREHRLVMEAHLGRYLEPHEVVHHKDGNHQNNHLDNLELFSCNSDHLKSELQGRMPEWTPDGHRRILEGCRRPRSRRVCDTH
jgi:hypothetical protein